jgi:hypothetical protein
MRELGIEFISVFGLPPVDFVHLAPLESLGYPGFSLKDDVRIRHDLLAAMAATRGIETTIEMAPGLTIGDLSAVMAAIDHVGSPGLRVSVDTMHVLPEGSHVRADGSGRRGASACRHAAWGHGSPSALYGGSA